MQSSTAVNHAPHRHLFDAVMDMLALLACSRQICLRLTYLEAPVER